MGVDPNAIKLVMIIIVFFQFVWEMLLLVNLITTYSLDEIGFAVKENDNPDSRKDAWRELLLMVI